MELNSPDPSQIKKANGTTQQEQPLHQGQERRRCFRAPVHWPVRLFRQGSEISVETVTQDLSSDGFYCLSAFSFTPGELVACTLSLPENHPDDTQRTLSLNCKVQIVRVLGPDENGIFGLGCHMENYTLTV